MVGYTVNAVYHSAIRYLVLDTVPTLILAQQRAVPQMGRNFKCSTIRTGIDETTVLIGSSRGWRRNRETPTIGTTAKTACLLCKNARVRLGQAWCSHCAMSRERLALAPRHRATSVSLRYWPPAGTHIAGKPHLAVRPFGERWTLPSLWTPNICCTFLTPRRRLVGLGDRTSGATSLRECSPVGANQCRQTA